MDRPFGGQGNLHRVRGALEGQPSPPSLDAAAGGVVLAAPRLPTHRARSLASFRNSDIQSFVKALAAGDANQQPLAASTVELLYTWVSTIFTAAVRDRVIAFSPCMKVRRPTIERPPVVPLPVETVKALIDAVPELYRALIVLGAGTGARISEALALTNDRIDWLRMSMRVDRQLAGIESGHPVFGPLKDKQNKPRSIPLPESVVDVLSAHVAQFGLGPDGLIFTNPNGTLCGATASPTCGGLQPSP